MLLLGMLLVFDFNFFGVALAEAGAAKILLQGLTIAMMVIWIFVFTYVWPLLSRFDNTVKNTVTNAAYMSIRYLGSTMSMLISDVIIIAIGYIALFYMAWITAFMVLMGYPLLAWINSTMLDHIFEKYMPKQDPAKDKEVRPILQDINLDGTLKEGTSEDTAHDLENLKNKNEE
jgi:uncharacterized membrane protein YesL